MLELKKNEHYKVALDRGYLDITVNPEDDFPGIDVEYILNPNKDFDRRPRLVFEKDVEKDKLRCFVWNGDEDPIEEIVFSTSKPALSPETLTEFVGQIVNIFEGFCAEKEIMIDNPERKDYDESDATIIFGDDYDDFEITVRHWCDTYELYESQVSKAVANKMAGEIIDVLGKMANTYISVQDICTLKHKLISIFQKWDIVDINDQ